MAGEDQAVVAAARAGDESAFTALVERHRRELLVHCYRMLGSLDESEDLVQETFLRAWKNLPGLESPRYPPSQRVHPRRRSLRRISSVKCSTPPPCR
jgi:DNA-directed RNA polymerase specialized sigma24 family protein